MLLLKSIQKLLQENLNKAKISKQQESINNQEGQLNQNEEPNSHSKES